MTVSGAGPLAGVHILVTRPPELTTDLGARLRDLGATVDSRPSIALQEPRDAREAEHAVSRADEYDWVLFTSANGVRFFADRAANRGVLLAGLGARIGVIGAGTARALAHCGRRPDVTARRSDAPGFAAELRDLDVEGRRVLLVRPEATAGTLEAALNEFGASVDSVAFYRNEPAPGVDRLAEDVIRGRYGLIVFTSPSSLSRLIDAAGATRGELKAMLERTPAVAIGRTTAAAFEAAGLRAAAVAAQPTTEGIVKAVLAVGHVLPSAAFAASVAQETGLSASAPKKTAMHALHVEAGARMVEFAGWDMPVQYTGVLAEHNAVRTHAGLFDVSHMGEAMIRGSHALAFLQRVTSNDVAALTPGRAQYTALTTPEGTFVDDLLVYMLAEGDYLLVLNAANTAKDLEWLRRHASEFDVGIDDQTEAWSLLALQGPAAREILQPLVPLDLGKMKYYRFGQTQVDGVDCIVSRTGYTGEHGFEIYAPAAGSADIWRSLCRLGAPLGLQPVGLAARDTLRLEAKMALYGNDIDETTTVLEADLGWIVKLNKGEFIGRDALARQAEEGIRRKLVGFEMRGRGIARQGYPVRAAGQEVGRVTSGSFAPFLKKNIGLAYVPVEHAEPGTGIEVLIRGRAEDAQVVPTPFYKRR